MAGSDLTIADGYQSLLATKGLNTLDALFTAKGEILGKPGLASWRKRLRVTLEDGGGARTFYLKRFCDPPASARREVARSGCVARSVAGMEWTWMLRLMQDGIPCVEPVAFGEQIDGRRESRSAILTAAVAGKSLEAWVAESGPGDSATVGELIDPLAALIARLHDRGYVHRDLYLSHVFYDPGSPPATALRLIDLQRVFRPRWRMRRWIIKDLASLNYSTPSRLVSTKARVRWLRRYLEVTRLDGPARALLYRIVGKTQWIARRKQARRKETLG
jgi:heptose I phosphotransferase